MRFIRRTRRKARVPHPRARLHRSCQSTPSASVRPLRLNCRVATSTTTAIAT